MGTPVIGQILLQVVLISLNAVFACAEIAVLSMNHTRMEQLAAEGDRRARRLLQLTSQPARFLATIQVAITLSGFLASAFAADNFSDKLVGVLVDLGIPLDVRTLDAISVVVITLILSYFTLVFGELVPKRLAMKKAEPLALALSGLIACIARICAPVVWMLTGSTNQILHLFGVDPNMDDDGVSEEDIRMMVEQGNKKGTIDKEERDFIHNVFEFDDLSAAEFATHRTEMTILWAHASREEWEKIINATWHTWYPVCEKSVDHVIGVINVWDFLRLREKSPEELIKTAMRPAYFVPESVKADVLFRQMKQSRNFFAVVLDEYGGTFGVVTIKDLIELLVGRMDESDAEESAVEPVGEKCWRVRGMIRLSELAEIIRTELPTEEYETLGGYVFGLYGSIPEDGDQFRLTTDTLEIEVIRIQEHKLEEAIVSLKNVPREKLCQIS